MTKEEILAMEAGKELDKLVAENIFEFEVKRWETYRYRVPSQYGEVWELLPKYSTDILSAWQVALKMGWRLEYICSPYYAEDRYDNSTPSGQWRVGYWVNKREVREIKCAAVPEAISKAGLLAKLGAS